jgi:hypothetical protein
MTKRSIPKVAAEKVSNTNRKPAPRVVTEKATNASPKVAIEVSDTHHKTTVRGAGENASESNRKPAPKVVTKKSRGTTPKVAAEASDPHRKPTAKLAPEEGPRRVVTDTTPKAAEKTSDTHNKRPPRVVSDKSRDATPKKSDTHRKATLTAAEKVNNSHRESASSNTTPRVATAASDTHREITAQFHEFPSTQVPDSMRLLAERNVAQTRELFSRSANALQSVLENWERALDAAGQGVVALNRKIIDIVERNISTSFDLAKSLAGAKNLAEVVEVQAAYWGKQFDEMRMQAEELRALSTKVTADVMEQIKTPVTSNIEET